MQMNQQRERYELEIAQLNDRIERGVKEKHQVQSYLDEFKCQYYGLTDTVRRDKEFTKLITTIKDVERALDTTERERSKQ